MIKAVLFDFDGTLIDTNELIFKSYRKAYREVFNKEMSDEEILFLYGKPLYSSLIETYGNENGERMYDIYRSFNSEMHDSLAKEFDGACKGVKKIKDLGYKIGIVTSKRLHMVKRGLELIGLNDIFDIIVTPENTQKTKPDPEPVLMGCSLLNVLPDETIYVGDSIFDMKAGKQAGTKLCVVKYTLTPMDEFIEFAPEYAVNSIEELTKTLKG